MNHQNIDETSFVEMLDAVEKFQLNVLMPLEQQVEQEDAVPQEIEEQMREMGFFGLTIPPQYGGLGLTMTQEARFQMLMSRTSPAFRYIYSTNIGLGSRGLLIMGTEEQKQYYLPKFASGELIAALAVTEPDAGSDVSNLRTTAQRVEGGYILNGTKRFITNAPKADVVTVLARTSKTGKPHQGISAFLVHKDTEGYEIGQPEKKMGQRGSQIADIYLDNVFVPEDRLIGEQEGKGFYMAMGVLDHGRINVAATAVGMAERLIKEARNYALEREQFGQPIANFQLVQAMLADSATECYAARCMTLDAAKKVESNQSAIQEAACAKYFASEMVCRVADNAVQIFGGAGYIAEYPVERMFRDARVLRLYEGTSQIMQLVIAKSILKNPD